jgi:HK97 family phage prohead protease
MGREVSRLNKEKETRYITIEQIETRSTDEDKMTIGGYVTKFNTRSVVIWDFVEYVAKGAFRNSLKNNVIKSLWNHDSNMVIGSTKNSSLRLWEDEIGLKFELDLPNTSWGKDAYETVRTGLVDGVSFGFYVKEDEWEYLADEGLYKRTLLDVDLFEISPTPFPAYQDSQVSSRSLDEFKAQQEAEQRERQQIEKLKYELDLLLN